MPRHNTKFSKPATTRRKTNNTTELRKIKNVMKAQSVTEHEAKVILEADRKRKAKPNLTSTKKKYKDPEMRKMQTLWNSVIA